MARIGFVLARLLVGAFVVLTAGYCLLAYIPFTYHQVHLGGLLPWLSAFARLHPYLYWLAFVAAVATLPDLRNSRKRLGSVLFLVVFAAVGVMLLLNPLLVHLENNLRSLLWCVAALIPLVWLAVLDWSAQKDRFKWVKQESAQISRLFRACLLAAVYAWLFSAILVVGRYPLNKEWTAALAGSVVSHIVVFMAIFLAINFTGAIAGVVSRNPVVHTSFYLAAALVLLALVLKFVAFAPLSFSGPWAILVAAAIAFSLVFFLSGIGIRLYRPEDGEIDSPLTLLLTPFGFLRSLSRTLQIVVLVAGSLEGVAADVIGDLVLVEAIGALDRVAQHLQIGVGPRP
jgi:MFS family permease